MKSLTDQPRETQSAIIVTLNPAQFAAVRGDLNAIRRVLEEVRDQQAHLAEVLAGARPIRTAGWRRR